MPKEPLPTTEEIRDWLTGTLKHSFQVEYYLHALNLGHNDPHRPHDIEGPGNKFEWPVIKGLAMQYRNNDLEFFEKYVLPSIRYHRQHQHHHIAFNSRAGSLDSMKVGALDAICSHLDDRKYHGGPKTFDEIIRVIKKNDPEKVKYFWMVYSRMKDVKHPDLGRVKSFQDFENVGLPYPMYNKAVVIVDQTIGMLKNDHGYKAL